MRASVEMATMRRTLRRRLLVIVLGAISITPCAADTALVAVAANLVPVARDLVRDFELHSGHSIKLSSAASGILTQQIIRGAPFELFLAADASYPARLCDRKLCLGDPVHYADGRLVLYTSHAATATTHVTKHLIVKLFGEFPDSRVAIANPVHAPYGKAARDVFVYLGIWESLKPRLVIGESVAQATRFAATRTVGFALLPESTRSQLASKSATLISIPTAWHGELRQHMVLLNGAGKAAYALRDYVLSTEAKRTLVRHGYQVEFSN